LGGHDDVIEFLGLSADGKKLLTASSRATKVCDLNTRQWETLRSKGQPEKYAVVPKTHDILRLAKGPKGSEISDVFSGEVLCRFEKLLEFQHWAINADATRVVTSWGNVIEAWDLGRRNLLGKYRGHADVIDYLAFASDGLRIASADLRQLKVWNLELPGPISRLLPTDPGYSYRFGIRGASFGLQPETAIAADSAGVFRLWDIQAGSVAWEVATRGDILGFAMASSQGRMGLIKEEVIQIWDVPARKLLHTIRPMARPLRSLSGNPISFSPDASELVAVLSGTVEFWNTATWTLRTNLLRRAVSSAVFSPDTTLVAVAGVGLDLLDARSLQSIARLNKEDFMTLVEFDPAGRQIATAVGSDVLVYDVRTRSLKGRLQGHERITALAFSPDGTRLVSGVGDATIRIWDAVNLNIILTLRGHTGLVTSLAFAPNGQKLLSASLDGSLMLWNTRPLNWEFGGGTNRLGPESRNALRQSH
jgi:WD40 repeat protein